MFKYNCLNPIASVGLDLFSNDYEKVEDLNQADAALVRSAAMHDLELPDSLLAVARAGAGVNNIPLDKCAEKGIVVFNTPGANANGVKELLFAVMLYVIFIFGILYHIYLTSSICLCLLFFRFSLSFLCFFYMEFTFLIFFEFWCRGVSLFVERFYQK